MAWPSVWSCNLHPGACGESGTGTHWEGWVSAPAKEGVGSPGQGGLPGAPTQMPPGCLRGPRVARCLVDWGSEPSGSVSSAESLGASGRASASLVRLRRPPACPGWVPPTPGRSLSPPTALSPSQEEFQGLLLPTEGGSWPCGSPGCDPLSRPSCEAVVRVASGVRNHGLACPFCPPTPKTLPARSLTLRASVSRACWWCAGGSELRFCTFPDGGARRRRVCCSQAARGRLGTARGLRPAETIGAGRGAVGPPGPLATLPSH